MFTPFFAENCYLTKLENKRKHFKNIVQKEKIVSAAW